MQSTEAILTAYAVLHSVEHILAVSTSVEDARQQVNQLLELVNAKAQEEQIPQAMLREAGREMLERLL